MIRVINRLSKEEVSKLKAMVKDYGTLGICAEKCNIRYDTLRRIISNGYGLEDKVKSIRKNLLK